MEVSQGSIDAHRPVGKDIKVVHSPCLSEAFKAYRTPHLPRLEQSNVSSQHIIMLRSTQACTASAEPVGSEKSRKDGRVICNLLT